ncbi:ComF family protein [Vaginella massiliensis]|uniref:ComF family protein n=1 Tax=Vaginella massiliensis TaxID=1816680 RepID=UPI000B060B5F|nr:phosphoribosyltransferase family protein [Vaginella massiliensis]
MEFKIILNSLIDLFFPHRCIGCDEVLPKQDYLCLSCLQKLSYTYFPLNNDNLAYHKLRSLCELESATAVFYFRKENISQQILHAIKYKNQAALGKFFVPKLDLNDQRFDGIIPMPIHHKRLKERGYNQVLPFANELAEVLQIPVLDEVIVRQKHLKTQTKKHREARFQSLENTFLLKQIPPDGHYILVDDVLTTGSTLAHCVNLFQTYPKIKISIITLAYTI